MRVFWIIFIFFLNACVSPGTEKLSDLTVPLNELQRIVISVLPVGKRAESRNNREFYSEYFVVRGGDLEPAEDSDIRSTAHITILGDRRPYQLAVRVLTERRGKSGQFELVKFDEGLAKMITRKIQSTLHKRRDDRNIIDDFRVF